MKQYLDKRNDRASDLVSLIVECVETDAAFRKAKPDSAGESKAWTERQQAGLNLLDMIERAANVEITVTEGRGD